MRLLGCGPLILREARKVKWTKAYRAAHGKDLTNDTTFELERKRNRPERYNRDVMQKTMQHRTNPNQIPSEGCDWLLFCVLLFSKTVLAVSFFAERPANVHS